MSDRRPVCVVSGVWNIPIKAYADRSTEAFYPIGKGANTAGISIYIMGATDNEHLADTHGAELGKATVTGTRSEIAVNVLETAPPSPRDVLMP